MRRSKKKHPLWMEILAALIAAVLFFAICTVGGYALMPRHDVYGAVWEDYLGEPRDSIDLLILGSSRAYCNVIPGELYRQSGLSSFLMAGPSQTLPVTYYYLQEALRTQSPRCVLLELSGVFYRQYEDYSLANICYMPYTMNRFLAARQCEPELMTTAVFPLETFHYRLLETADESDPYSADRKMLCGYTPLTQANPQMVQVKVHSFSLLEDALFTENLYWLRQIAFTCREKSIPLVLFYAPTCLQQTVTDYTQLETELAQLEGVTFCDWSRAAEELWIDPETDWYDAIHLNVNGARKFSDVLAEQLVALGVQSAGRYDRDLWETRASHSFNDSQ